MGVPGIHLRLYPPEHGVRQCEAVGAAGGAGRGHGRVPRHRGQAMEEEVDRVNVCMFRHKFCKRIKDSRALVCYWLFIFINTFFFKS